MFLCPACMGPMGREEKNFPACKNCGHTIEREKGVWLFSKEEPIRLEGEGGYIGYENIGEDFEPSVTYWHANTLERYGVYEACAHTLAQMLAPGAAVLDLGAGLGSAAVPLAKEGVFTVAADISTRMLATAVQRGRGNPLLYCARMNAYSLHLATGSIDAVIENAVLHLLASPQKAVQEIYRVLKPGGFLVRFGSYALPLTEQEAGQNNDCNRVLSDISDYYYAVLAARGFQSASFNSFQAGQQALHELFLPPFGEKAEGFSEVFTEKVKFRCHRLAHGAHSDLQGTPKPLLEEAWRETELYAAKKYGADFANIPGFSRYGAALDVYRRKNTLS